MSAIPKELIETYRTAIYRVDTPQGVITFYIDQPSPELAALHRDRDVKSSAFITAYHPYSVPVAGDENEKAQQALLDELRVRGYQWLEGAGEDAKEAWPAEPSVLVLGISREEATRLAEQFRQNAYVFCDEAGKPHLVLAR